MRGKLEPTDAPRGFVPARLPFPLRLWLGLALIAIFWFASWTRLGALGEYAFFPQWFGLILVLDALVALRRGASLLTRNPREFVALFLLSAPAWWLFEGLNAFVQNWHYLGAENYPAWKYILVASINFSTVIPAVFEMTELVATFAFVDRWRAGRGFTLTPRVAWLVMYAGAFAFAAVILAPRYAFPLTWLWVVLIADPLNYLRGRASLLAQLARGNARPLVALGAGALLCGLVWELWNFYAMPKWYYTVPFVGFAKIFEMPLLGYGGYLPFAWELYALYHLAWGKLGRAPGAVVMDMGSLSE